MIVKTKSYVFSKKESFLYLDFLPVCVQRTGRRDCQMIQLNTTENIKFF